MTKEERDAVYSRCTSIDNIIIGLEREINLLRTHLDKLAKVCGDEPPIDIVRCKDCKYDHKCNHSVQRITSKPDYMSIVYVPIGWCERGEREGE